jgi:hypothetical protein
MTPLARNKKMANIRCNDFLEAAGEWMEGDRLPGTEEHLRSCARCRSVLADLEAIRTAGLAMGAEEVAPPARVWHRLRIELETQRMIHPPSWAERLAGLLALVPRPALTAAFLTLMAVGGVLLGYQSSYRANEAQWLARTQIASASVATQLSTVQQNDIINARGYDPAVEASFHQNMAIVDNMIAVCEKSVREDPENEMTRDYLYGAYKQKAALLATMSERGMDAQ